MSKFDLRDISERLAASRDTEAVVFEFLGYLQAVRSDWRASLAFYEVSQDALVNVYSREGRRLSRKDVRVPVDSLPARLVRKFFHPSAFFNHADRRSLLSQLLQSSPSYDVPAVEAQALRPLCALLNWTSCVCVPLADQEDMLAMLIIASDKKNAIGSKAIGELIPLKAIAALALSQHLYRGAQSAPGRAPVAKPGAAAAEFQEHIRRLGAHAAQLENENRTKSDRLQALAGEIELLDKNSTQYKHEVERVKSQLFALEEQSTAATQHLNEAYSRLGAAEERLQALQQTVGFMKEVCQVLSQEHDREEFTRTLVSWFCDHFGVERCSLMLLDDARESLHIAAQRGIEPSVASQVRVRIGQGIAGWVAHNRKPLFVRVKDDANGVHHTGQDAYNSDSFICVPLIHNNRLCGVMNLSNKRSGMPFEDYDLDRALLAGSLLAISLADQDRARRTEAWA